MFKLVAFYSSLQIACASLEGLDGRSSLSTPHRQYRPHSSHGWHARVDAVRAALAPAEVLMHAEGEDALDVGGRSPVLALSKGGLGVRVACASLGELPASRDSDVVVLVTSPGGATSVLPCGAEATEVRFDELKVLAKEEAEPLASSTRSFGQWALSSLAPSEARVLADDEKSYRSVHALLFARVPSSSESSAPVSYVLAASSRVSETGRSATSNLDSDRRLSAPPPPTSSSNSSASASSENCGRDGLPACESADQKNGDAIMLLIEGKVALLIAFFGTVAIARASNKYARE